MFALKFLTIGRCVKQEILHSRIFQRALIVEPHFDFRALKRNKDEMQRSIETRNLSSVISIDTVLEKHGKFAKLTEETKPIRNSFNQVSRKILRLENEETSKKKEDLIARAKDLEAQLHKNDKLIEQAKSCAFKLYNTLPNFAHPRAPVGSKEKAKILRVVNNREYTATCKEHVELCLKYGMYATDSVPQATGLTFYSFKNDGVLLEHALTQFSTKEAIKGGFALTKTPDVVRGDVAVDGLYSEGPNNQIRIVFSSGELDLYFSSESELPLAVYDADTIMEKKDLPIRKVYTRHYFPSEAKNTELESKVQHEARQLTKVELIAFAFPDESENITSEVLAFQERLFSSLGLHYRVLEMPTEELGARVYHKYNIEAWLPGQNRWGEISSISNCTDYESRRLYIRIPKPNKMFRTKYAHTINATSCVVPKMIAAIIEQFQDNDGQISIPEPLRLYFNNREYLNLDTPQ